MSRLVPRALIMIALVLPSAAAARPPRNGGSTARPTAAQISRIVRGARGQFRACYENAANAPESVRVRIIWHANGSAVTVRSDPSHEGLEQCVAGVAGRLGISGISVTYPLVFNGGSSSSSRSGDPLGS